MPRKPKKAPLEFSVNVEQGLYVIPCAGGYSCLGFDVAIKWAKGYVEWMQAQGQQLAGPDESLRGTKEGYDDYLRIQKATGDYCARTGKRCTSQLLPQLIAFEGQRVEVEDMEGEVRDFRVGKSTGWCPIHLEIENPREGGGPGADSRGYKWVRPFAGKVRR